MDDHKLKIFCTVAETKSFSKASKILYLTQPAISLRIQAIEDEYGARLFDRSGNKIKLTSAGKILYKYASEIQSLYSQTEKEINELAGIVKGTVSIGASTTLAKYHLPPLIVEFKQKYPTIMVHFTVGNTNSIVEDLFTSKIDIGLIEGDLKNKNIIIENLLADELVLIFPNNHRFAKQESVSIKEIIDEPFIMREIGSGTRQIIEKHLADHKINLNQLNVSMYLGSTEAIKCAVKEGLGVSIVSEWAIIQEKKYGLMKDLKFNDIRFVRNFDIIYQKRSYQTQASNIFLKFLKNFDFEKKKITAYKCTPNLIPSNFKV